MTPVAMLVKITTLAGHRDDFVAQALAVSRFGRGFDGCLVFDVLLSADDPDVLWTYSVFADAATPQRLAASHELAPLVEQATPLIANREVMMLTPAEGTSTAV